MKNILMKFILLFTLLFSFSYGQTEYSAKKILELEGVPWGIDFLSNEKMIISQKNGKIFLYDLNLKESKELLNPPKVFYSGQGGLLDVKVSPRYEKDKWIYFTYSKNVNAEGVTTLARAKLRNYSFYSWEELLVSKSASTKGVHFGSRITFDENNHIYFSIGDRGIRKNAQDLQNHAGSIIRLNLDGTVPKDNPFVNSSEKLNEIYSYGHRNPQGIFYDKKSKKLWAIEHGPRGGDEINLIEKSKNYGWPTISYGKEYWAPLSVGIGTHKKGMEQPKKYYIPSIAPSSLILYSGNKYKNLKNKLLVGALKSRHINILTIDEKFNITNETRILENLSERIRNIVSSPNGLIYFSTDSGKIYFLNQN